VIWGILYLATLLGTFIYVERGRERETRIAIRTLFLASLLTLAAVLSRATFVRAQTLLMLLDFLVLAAFLVHALWSRRYWTLCLPAFQSITCTTHIAMHVAPEIVPRVYSAGQGFWAYPQLLVILLAAIWAKADRRQRERLSETRAP
jgi:hypothetical protein